MMSGTLHLGFGATGSTPAKGLHAELVRLYKEEGLSFNNVITFNLDEYCSMEPDL
jgi:glucosamine-6-phosphate deaminase